MLPTPCQTKEIYVPGYCRKASSNRTQDSRRLTLKEKQDLKDLMTKLKPDVQLVKTPTPTITGKTIHRAPHRIIDTLTHDLRISYFVMPWFHSGAVARMLDVKYRHKYPDPQKRYEVIETEFCKMKKIKELPLLYEYVVLKTCLMVG